MAYEAKIQKILDRVSKDGPALPESLAIALANSAGGTPGNREFSGNVWWEVYSAFMDSVIAPRRNVQ